MDKEVTQLFFTSGKTCFFGKHVVGVFLINKVNIRMFGLIYLSFANSCRIKRNFKRYFFKSVKIDYLGIKNYVSKSDSSSYE